MSPKYYKENKNIYYPDHHTKTIYAFGKNRGVWYACVYFYDNFMLNIKDGHLKEISKKRLILDGIEEYAP